ncbi:MAG TPA: 3-keto-5-aminohexanoate cleavage protein [Kofleriaceae bacterium]|nr:3-keto-5-aminohexanoate cleavage protein [Kofleriaceae bacterium]
MAGPAILIEACINGGRRRDEHAAVPLTAAELAREASAAVAVGAAALHFHPRDGAGVETLEPDACAEAIEAVRAACPGVPLGLSTGIWIAGGAERERLVSAWHVLPDFVSVNFIEEGAAELCRLLLARGVQIEAGLTSLADVEVMRLSGMAREMCRFLVEVEPEDPEEAAAVAASVGDALEGMGSARQLHHGCGQATWRVIEAAIARGRDVRAGLEDSLFLPDGTAARDNAALVSAAVELARRAGRAV